MWEYQARPIRVIDGDTIQVTIDVGFRETREDRLRLLNVNCPESRGESRPDGLEAKIYTTEWLAHAATGPDLNWPLTIVTRQDDAFGRYLAVIWRKVDGACLNDDLVRDGHAVPDVRT